MRFDDIRHRARGKTLRGLPLLMLGLALCASAWAEAQGAGALTSSSDAFAQAVVQHSTRHEVRETLRTRTLSRRAFDGSEMLCDAEIMPGTDVDRLIGRLLARPETAYIHAHYARPGCFTARLDRP